MRRCALIVLVLFGCLPRGPQSNTGPLDSVDGDADIDTDVDSDTDADVDLDDCTGAIDDTGPWPDHPIAAAGTTATATAYTTDAGLAAVVAAAEAATERTAANLPVTEAVVLARGFASADATQVGLWLGDRSGALYAYDLELGMPASAIRPGDVVSFTATEVNNFFGTAELTGQTGLSVVRSGDPVWVVDGMTGTPVTYEAHAEQVVEVYGELISGPDTSCGANCFDLQYAGGLLTLRTFSTFDQVGDCVHWIGPVSQFSSTPQLFADDFDWYRSY